MSAPGAAASPAAASTERAADVVVVGAGLAGLIAARRLAEEGAQVLLVDKGRRPGGRASTRRVADLGRIDQGPQFFTVRSEAFAGEVDRWRALGVPVVEWSRGHARARHVAEGPEGAITPADGHPRYVIEGGFGTLTLALTRALPAAVTLQPAVRAVAVAERDGRLAVHVEPAHRPGPPRVVAAPRVLLTAPTPQALALCEAGGLDLGETGAALARLRWGPTLSWLAVLDDDPGLPAPGGVQLEEGPVEFLADGARRGVGERPTLTAHASGPWSLARFDAPDAVVADRLQALLRPWLGATQPLAWRLKRWRYARPLDPWQAGTARVDGGGGSLALAGDALGGAAIEGACTSGLASAEDLADVVQG